MLANKNDCVGCGACYNICPTKAIKMVSDKEGFSFPVISKSECINCGLCEKVCPLNCKHRSFDTNICAAINSNHEVLINSSSGGVFFELANYILNDNGYVCGAIINEENKVVHSIIHSKNKLHLLMNSKYVQSDLSDCFKRIRILLNKGSKVLFVGTPCQVFSMRTFLQRDYKNLLLVDFICHGVPSPSLLDKYLNSVVKREKKYQINDINFRSKDLGWKNFGLSFSYYSKDNDKKKYFFESHLTNSYLQAFMSNISLRESCYHCEFKQGNRYSDITLGDFWGVEKTNLDIENIDDGVSIIIFHNNKFVDIFKKCNLKLLSASEISLNNNSAYKHSVNKPYYRKRYLKKVTVDNFQIITSKMCKRTIYDKVVSKIKK